MMLWEMLDTFPAGDFLVPLGIAGLAIFFITSSDSASQVVDNIASNGSGEPPVWQRIFWAVTEGATALVLLHSGDTVKGSLKNLQSVSIIFALPLTFVMLAMCYSMWVGLRTEDGSIKPRNKWRTPGIDAFANLTFTCLCCVGLCNKSGYQSMGSFNRFCCWFWDAGNSPINCLWVVVTTVFPCITQTKNYLEFERIDNSRRVGAQIRKIVWIFMIIAPWVVVMILSQWCDKKMPTDVGPVVRECDDDFESVDGWVAVMFLVVVAVGVIQRGWIRQLRGIEKPANFITDACWFCFCPQVAIWQVAMEPRVNVSKEAGQEGASPMNTTSAPNAPLNKGPGDEQL